MRAQGSNSQQEANDALDKKDEVNLPKPIEKQATEE